MPGVAMLAGEKLAVAPLGRPVAANVTADLKPVPAAVVNFTFNEDPVDRVALAVSLASENVGTVTAKLSVCVVVKLPPFAVMVGV